MDRPASLPHTGLATFCKAPYVADATALDADVAVLGVPFDASVGMRPGCRQAPRALRDASTRFGFLGQKPDGFYDVNTGRTRLGGVRWADVGDADTVPFDADYNHAQVAALVGAVLDRGALPVAVGGDHSVSYPLVRAFADHYSPERPLDVVLLDAHLDYRDVVMGQRLTNNSPFRRIHELPFTRHLATFGVRGIKSTGREVEEQREHGHALYTARQVADAEPDALLDALPFALGDVYLSIDIDALDPSIAPGTESPEAEGLSFTQARRLVEAVGRRARIVGIDLVEVNPYLDTSEMTAHLAVQLLIEAAAAAFDGRREVSRG